MVRPVVQQPARQPHELLDDGFAPDPCDLLVIGCGNILRGDDAVGPVLIRHLYGRGVPDGVRLVDGGTAGMDVAFGMRGAARVVIVDASSTGAAPGTVYKVPAEELADLPPIDGLHTHNFRWDHALSFSTWLLGPLRPTDITVYLVEAGGLEPGAPLSPEVEAAMTLVLEAIVRDHYPAAASQAPESVAAESFASTSSAPEPVVEITASGSLRLSAALASRYFPADVCVARRDGDALVLMPLVGPANGGLVLKQYTAAGDRSVLISEVCAFAPVAGRFPALWDDEQGALRVVLEALDRTGADRTGGSDGARPGSGPVDADRGHHGGGGGAGPVGGRPDRADPGRRRAAAAEHVPNPGEGRTGGLGDPADRGPATAPDRRRR